jgi:hypothetical protein
MTTNKTTVTWWHEATTLNDRQSEKLNGGSGFLSVAVNGGLGAVEINKSNGAQINLIAEHGKLQYRSYRNRHGYSNHYFF